MANNEAEMEILETDHLELSISFGVFIETAFSMDIICWTMS